jgi:hypothetical protein
MKLLTRLAVLAFVANALYRGGTAYLNHFQFTDAARQAATVRDQTDQQLHQRIVELADQHDIPLAEDAFTVQRDNRRVIVRGAYTKNILLLPRYEYPWRLTWDIDTYVVDPPSLTP